MAMMESSWFSFRVLAVSELVVVSKIVEVTPEI
jgi:hypothetical protein